MRGESPEKKKQKRTLIYIPIIHSCADMGTLGKDIRRAYMNRYGEKKWLEKAKIIQDYWKEIRLRIGSLSLDYKSVKIYQDGLPICGRELEIVETIALQGSENHRFLMELVEKGAEVVGTEDPELLMAEYRRLLSKTRPGEGALEKATSIRDEFFLERDKYIAERIGDTLDEGKTGIVFIGLIHRLNEFLPSDIEVVYLLSHITSHT